MDKSGDNLAAHQAISVERETPIKVRQVKYLHNIVEQDHRVIKRRIKPMMGFKDFRCARIILSGIETMHMIRKDQMKEHGVTRTAADQFYSLVSQGILVVADLSWLAELIATQPGYSPAEAVRVANALLPNILYFDPAQPTGFRTTAGRSPTTTPTPTPTFLLQPSRMEGCEEITLGHIG